MSNINRGSNEIYWQVSLTQASVLPKTLHKIEYSTSHYKNKTLQLMEQIGRLQVEEQCSTLPSRTLLNLREELHFLSGATHGNF